MGYEWFKFSHFVAALIFVLFLFFHCDHTLSSWYASMTSRSIAQ
jgi:thiosulfate reductase cytochrome b subunit